MGTSQLGAMLVSEGLLTESDRRTVRQISGQGGAAFARGVLAMGLLDENELASFLAEKTRWKIAKKDLFSESNQDVWTIFDSALLQLLEVFPLKRDQKTIHVAMVDPLDLETINQLEFFSELKVHPVISTQSQIRSCLKKMIQSYHPRHSTLENFIENHAAAASRRIAIRENISVPIKRLGVVAPPQPESPTPSPPSTPSDISQAFTATSPKAPPPTPVAPRKTPEPASDELVEGLDIDDDLGGLDLEDPDDKAPAPTGVDDSEPFEEPVEESLAVGPTPSGAGIPKIDVNTLSESDELGDFDLDGEFEAEEGEAPVEGLLDSLGDDGGDGDDGSDGGDQDLDLDAIAGANEEASLATKDDLDDLTALASPEPLEEPPAGDLTDSDFMDSEITEPDLTEPDLTEPDLSVDDASLSLENHEASLVSPDLLDDAIGELDSLNPIPEVPAEADIVEPPLEDPVIDPVIDHVMDPLVDPPVDPLSLDDDPLLSLDLPADQSLPEWKDGSQNLMLSLNEALIFVSLGTSRIQVSKKLGPKFLDWGMTTGQLGINLDDKTTTLMSWKTSPSGQDLAFETTLDDSNPDGELPPILKKALASCSTGLSPWSPTDDEIQTLKKEGVLPEPQNQTCWLGVQDEGKSKKVHFWFFASKPFFADPALHGPILDLFIRLTRLPQ